MTNSRDMCLKTHTQTYILTDTLTEFVFNLYFESNLPLYLVQVVNLSILFYYMCLYFSYPVFQDFTYLVTYPVFNQIPVFSLPRAATTKYHKLNGLKKMSSGTLSVYSGFQPLPTFLNTSYFFSRPCAS